MLVLVVLMVDALGLEVLVVVVGGSCGHSDDCGEVF